MTTNGPRWITDQQRLQLNDNTRVIVCARNPDAGAAEYDSDYCGNHSMTYAEARVALAEFIEDEEWAGWEFQVWAALDGMNYETIVDSAASKLEPEPDDQDAA